MIKNPALLGNCDINIAGSQSSGGSGTITRRARGAQMDSRVMAACLSGNVLAVDSPQEQRGGGGGGSSKKMQLGIWRSAMN